MTSDIGLSSNGSAPRRSDHSRARSDLASISTATPPISSAAAMASLAGMVLAREALFGWHQLKEFAKPSLLVTSEVLGVGKHVFDDTLGLVEVPVHTDSYEVTSRNWAVVGRDDVGNHRCEFIDDLHSSLTKLDCQKTAQPVCSELVPARLCGAAPPAAIHRGAVRLPHQAFIARGAIRCVRYRLSLATRGPHR